jgi:hypothetical protein
MNEVRQRMDRQKKTVNEWTDRKPGEATTRDLERLSALHFVALKADQDLSDSNYVLMNIEI